MEYRLQVEIWRGNVAGAVQIARERNEISDWIVAMAPFASYDLWELVSTEYAEKLEEDGQYHKAVTYLLATNKVQQAIEIFRRHRLFQEAISLTSLRLSPVDPLLEDLYTEWGQHLMKEGQFEQAAKCYLAMRHIQEAEMVNTRNCPKLNLQPPTHVKHLTIDNHWDLNHTYSIFSQHLMMGQWKEAYRSIHGHEPLKILLPVLTMHELLIKQLMVLTHGMTLTSKPVTPEIISLWDKDDIPNCKTGFPEFLVDRSEIDPVIPWQPYLIGEHTFPHHLLRVWHQHLNVTMATQELKTMHASLSQLICKRETMDDLPSTLVLVSMDLTLCLLALLMSETSRAITHFLQAMSTLHQGNHKPLLQALCRLMLPQGPKYLLKLQQEFTACRVLITMESHGDVNTAGGENHSSIKKFLTEIKDDSAISMSSLRCRELDCLRAYYYLAVLEFLKDNYRCVQHDNDSHDGMPNRKPVACEQSVAVTHDDKQIPISHKQTENIVPLNQTMDNCDNLNGNITTPKFDIKDISTGWNATHLLRNGKIIMSIGSSTVPQPLDQIQDGNGDDGFAIYGAQNKDVDRRPVCSDLPGISITSDAGNKILVSPSHERQPLLISSYSAFPLPLTKLQKSSLGSSSPVDPIMLPSKLPLLKISTLKSTICTSNILFTKSSMSWPSNSPLFMSTSNSPLLMSPSNSQSSLSPSNSQSSLSPSNSQSSLSPSSSNSPPHISWSSHSTQSLSSTSTLPSFLSPSHISPSSSLLRNSTNSFVKTPQCVGNSKKLSPEKIRTSTTGNLSISKGHLDYVNLLRLSKGILWDIQAKQEALTETLGYIHYAISQQLLKTFNGNNHCNSITRETAGKQSVNTRNNNSPTTLNSELEEDGGFNTTCLLSPSGLQETFSEIPRENSFNTPPTESFRTKTFRSSNVELPRVSFPQQIQFENVLHKFPVKNIQEHYLTDNMPLCQHSKHEHCISLQREQEPTSFRKSRKVLWMDGKETCTSATSDNNTPAFQVSRQAPDGSVIPVEWDDLPVDIKYSLPYVTLSLLKQEQESISRELKRVPELSEVLGSLTSSKSSLPLSSISIYSPRNI